MLWVSFYFLRALNAPPESRVQACLNVVRNPDVFVHGSGHRSLCHTGLQIIVRPGPALLGFLLGVAIGVMGLLSVVELWIKNAVDNGVASVTLALAVGAGLYYIAHPYFPSFEPHKSEHDSQVLEHVLTRRYSSSASADLRR